MSLRCKFNFNLALNKVIIIIIVIVILLKYQFQKISFITNVRESCSTLLAKAKVEGHVLNYDYNVSKPRCTEYINFDWSVTTDSGC